MKTLTLAKDLKLPADEAVAQKYAFIGRSGSGKTYGAMKLAELFLEAEAQVIVLDWVGNWWALRLAQDGKSPGFEHVYIFGGEHADAPLEATGGAMMADLLVDKHISAVLDLSPFRKGERTRFATAFAGQLFHRKKTARTACHLFLEEAQAFLPQMVRGDDARMVGVFEDIGKVGRNYGIGVSILSQRPQAVNKDVLNQTEVLLAFQTNGPQERKTIGGWVVEHGESNAALVDELPTLGRGDAFVWSPQWLQLCRRIHIAERVTYDASSTPTQRAKQVKPKSLTPADLAQLGEAMKATVEQAKANDPRELRKQIADLKKQVGSIQASSISTGPYKSDRPILTDADRLHLKEYAQALKDLHEAIADRADAILGSIAMRAKAEIDSALATAQIDGERRRADFEKRLESKGLQRILAKLELVSSQLPVASSQPKMPASSGDRVTRAPSPPRAVARAHPSSNGNLGKAEQRVLDSLAWWKSAGIKQPTRHQVAFVAGYTVNGHFNNTLGSLNTAGLASYPAAGLVALTEPGHNSANWPTESTDRDALIAKVRDVLRAEPQRRVFDVLVNAGREITREELATAASYTVNGHFNNTVGRLNSLGVARYPGRGTVGLGEMFDI